MTPSNIKRELIDKAIYHLESLIHELRDEVKNKLRGEGSTDEGGFNGTFGDYSAQSAENYLKEQALLRRAEAQKYERQIDQLKKLNLSAPTETISLGNLVVTDKGNFLIAFAQKPFDLNGEKYLFIGVEAPIYEVMAGKKPGDSFEFRGITYTVNSIT